MTYVPVVSKAQELVEQAREKTAASELLSGDVVPEKPETVSNSVAYADTMSQIPQLASLGPLFKSSARVLITEIEEEYVVHCVKHVFSNHFVFQVFHFLIFVRVYEYVERLLA